MAFLNVFLRTLGFLVATATFVVILNIFLYFMPAQDDDYNFIQGDKNSNNIIAVLDLNGPIINGINQSLVTNIIQYIDPIDVEKYLSELQIIKPKYLIIKINSPGGTVTASYALEKIINDFKKQNNIEVYFHTDSILTSGGYWVATTGNKIYADYGSIIGSIGVSGPSWYYYDNPTSISTGIVGQKIETTGGIKVFNQNAGNSKDLYNPFRKPVKEELIHLQNIVKEIYEDFILKVSNARKIEINTLKNEIGALIYSGKQAKQNS